MYAYSAMASYFARDNVALLGFSKVRMRADLFSIEHLTSLCARAWRCRTVLFPFPQVQTLSGF